MSKFQKKQPAVAAEPPKRKAWLVKKPVVKKAEYEPFHREITRTIKCEDGSMDCIWVFTEYKKPDFAVPQYRLHEAKFVQEDRDRRPMMCCPVSWEIDMEVRIEVYIAYQAHIAAAKETK